MESQTKEDGKLIVVEAFNFLEDEQGAGDAPKSPESYACRSTKQAPPHVVMMDHLVPSFAFSVLAMNDAH